MVVQVTTKGYEKLGKKLGDIIRLVKRPRELTVLIAKVMEQDVLRHFQESMGEKGRWKPLKLRAGKPLRDRGQLMNSISQSSDNKSAVVGTNVKYANMQNAGATIKPKSKRFLYIPLSNKGKMKRTGAPIPKGFQRGVDYVLAKKAVIPARPFMWLSNKAENDIIDIFVKGIETA